RNHWKDLSYDIYAFCDADLATGPDSVISAVRLVQAGYGLVIGSRYVDGAVVRRPPARKFVSRLYNRLLRLIFQDEVYDHQCGLKAFSSGALAAVLPASTEDSWFWDTEVILIAKKLAIKTIEMPVYWREAKAQRTHLKRLLKDIFLHGTGILRLKGDLNYRTKTSRYRTFLDYPIPHLTDWKSRFEETTSEKNV
ncbi:glycosyl transferase family 2, partial [mine drainage metagenome]